MKIYYIYRRNLYAAHLAAYLHLGINNPVKQKNIKIENMQYLYCGLGRKGEEIYIANYGRNKRIFINLLEGIAQIYNIRIKIVDLSGFEEVRYLISKEKTRLNIMNKLEAELNENHI